MTTKNHAIKKTHKIPTSISKWEESLRAYRLRQFEGVGSLENEPKPDMPCQDTLHEIFEWCVSDCGIRDSWKGFCMAAPIAGQYAIKRSKRFRCEFTFGIFKDEFFFECPFMAPQLIGKMNDEFWGEIVNLSRTGHFSYTPGSTGWGNKVDPHGKNFFKKHPSAIFSIHRNFRILDEGRTDPLNFDLGRMEVAWPFETPLSDALLDFRAAIHHGYRINALLYRAWYIEARRNMKRTWASFSETDRACYGDFRAFFRKFTEAE